MNSLIKKVTIGLLVLLSVFTFLLSNKSVYAISPIPDGAATFPTDGSGFSPEEKNVDPYVRKMWQEKKIPRGGKNPSLYKPTNGRRLLYDVYAGTSSNVKKRGFNVTPSSNFITFDGWAIIHGYHHHAKENQATYIGLVNKKNSNDRLIYKTAMRTNTTANRDIHDRQLGTCPENAFNRPVVSGQSGACNMNYNFTQFRAYIDMREVFGGENAGKEWEMYIIKRVENQLVYDRLILPFDTESFRWRNGTVTMRSGDDARNLVMVGNDVVKRDKINGNAPPQGTKRHFAPYETYRSNGVDDGPSDRVAVWYRVRDNVNTTVNGRRYEATNSNRWAPSAFWEFGGSIATLKHTIDTVDVRIRHVDENDRNSLITEEVIKNQKIGSNYTARAKADGVLKDSNGNPYRVVGSRTQTGSVTENKIFTFKYKAYTTVTINHVDELTGTIIDTEKVEREVGKNYKVSAKPTGHFKNSEGYDYVPTPASQIFDKTIHDKTTITFKYKASLEDPTEMKELEDSTEGMAKGSFSWQLHKTNDTARSRIDIKNNFEITGEHFAIRNVKYETSTGNATPEQDFGVEVIYPGTQVNIIEYYGNDTDIIIPKKINGRTVVGISNHIGNRYGGPFSGKRIKSIRIPNTVTSLSNSALANIIGLESLIFEGHINSVNTTQQGRVLYGSTSNLTIYSETNSPSVQALANNWSVDFVKIDGSNDVKQLYSFFESGEDPHHLYVTDTSKLKDQNISYSFSYDFTNYYWENYECVDQQDGHCFAWEFTEYTPAWEEEQSAEWTAELKTDHSYDETFIFDKDDPNELELIVGRKISVNGNEETDLVENVYKETLTVDRKDTKLQSQTWKEISETVLYNSDLGNKLPVVNGDKYYYPNDIDDNLQTIYKNKTPFDYSDYAIPLRVGEKADNQVTFVSNDNFFITQKTGFVFNLPYTETNIDRINIKAKEAFESYTGQKYDDVVITTPNEGSRYYLNVNLSSEQKPNTKYNDHVVFGRLGLNDVNIHLKQSLEFENYLFGHLKDDPIFIEQKTSVLNDVSYQGSITLTNDQMLELKEIENSREGKIHTLRSTDDVDIIDKVNRVVPLN